MYKAQLKTQSIAETVSMNSAMPAAEHGATKALVVGSGLSDRKREDEV